MALKQPSVLVFGLDGASWNVLDPLIENNKLPRIAQLVRNGCYGDLESCIPFYTFPAWKCYSTGKNPGKLGVYYFFDVDLKNQKTTLHDSTSFRSNELWDYFSENDITSAVVDMPTTYPPSVINGAKVSWGAPKRVKFTYPRSLEQELISRFDYKLYPDYYPPMNKDASILSIKQIINQRFDVATYILNRFHPSFFHLTVYDIDTIGHFYLGDMEKGDEKYGEVIEDFWTLIDSRIGSILDEFSDEKTYVFLMSDHGQTGVKGIFDISNWLSRKNLLVLRKCGLLPLLFPRSNLLKGVITWILKGAGVIKPLRSRMNRMGCNLLWDPLGSRVDLGKSKVTPSQAGTLYINRDLLNSEYECEQLRENIISEIRGLEDPETGEKLAREVYKREDIYPDVCLGRAPDIFIVPNEGYLIESLGRTENVWHYSMDDYSATHRLEGLFLASGPGIKRGTQVEGLRIYDLAPTFLHLFGLPVSRDIDGRVLNEIFVEDSEFSRREVIYQLLDEKERLRRTIRKLKSLGKI